MANAKRRTRATADVVRERFGKFRGIIQLLFGQSLIINVLALTGSFYMLQIYDRALTSGSIPTLIALSVLAIGLYLVQGLFDVLRSQILVRVGARLDARLAPLAHRVALEMPRYGYSTSEALERGRDVDTLRGFISSSGPIALLDLPWMPLFLIFVYALHPVLGLVTLGGAVVMMTLTVTTEFLSRRANRDMQVVTATRNMVADSNARNADVLQAMGFGTHALRRFEQANARHLELHTRASDIAGTFGGLSKVLRMMLQSALLGLGAFLTIKGEMSAGSIIACSVASSRALAPIDMALANWKGFIGARRAFARLKDTLATLDDEEKRIDLPKPRLGLKVENVTIVAPGSGAVLVSDVTFALKAGDGLGLIGSSGGGKTSLIKGLVNIWPLLRGAVRLDDADLSQWRTEVLGPHIGYLPQDVSLIEGTIAENIARFDPEAQSEGIVSAARAAGVHEMIVRLPDGYATEIGPNGGGLSAGQRQRIGLARALYGDPFLVVLDEPNSNLDAQGEAALGEALLGVRQRGGIVIVVAHRPSALSSVDLVGVIQNGKLAAFGPKSEILKGASPAQGRDAAPVQEPKVVEVGELFVGRRS